MNTATQTRPQAGPNGSGPAAHDPGEEYIGLIRRFPLRKLQSKADHQAALDVFDKLTSGPEGKMTDAEVQYAGVLVVLIAHFEERTLRFGDRPPSPARMLEHLMGERDMPFSEINDLLGRDATPLLNETGPFSEADAQALADHFGVDIRLFV